MPRSVCQRRHSEDGGSLEWSIVSHFLFLFMDGHPATFLWKVTKVLSQQRWRPKARSLIGFGGGGAFCQVHVHLPGGAEGEASSQVCKPHLPLQWGLVLVLLTAALGTFPGIQEGNGGGSHFLHSTPHLRPLPGRASASMSTFSSAVKTRTEGVAF